MKHWVAVGDAASAYDPLSSLGICKALESGIRAADALARHRLDEYEAWVRSSFEQYVWTRDAYYALETRWPDSPFWRARRGERAHVGRGPAESVVQRRSRLADLHNVIRSPSSPGSRTRR
jgi:flavin-dependent dehydrogenase